ncbi:MAG: flagellar hook assembly protein FlgD [Synergistetes bacterium]|nr:MAG: Flagellar hook capping protein [bacterium 42_11]MBC7331014.1 flagellar hook assembly protein FlgD [Synergistota bacterium]
MVWSTSGIGANYLYSSNGSTSSSGNSELDKDAFLKILITQLRYQDPLSPMDDKEFVAQMAQFSTLEQVTNMSKNLENFLVNFSWSQLVNLIGKTVKFTDSETGESVQGKVTGIKPTDSGIVLVINDGAYEIPINNVEEILI